MPFPVKQLIENQGKLICVKKDDLASFAFNLMIDNDFSQLPVVDADDRPSGMVTHERILRVMRIFNTHMDKLHVKDVLIEAPVFSLEDDLFDLLDQLKTTNAVLILDPEGILQGIVTSYDATEFFRRRTENLMRVEDIESFLKDFIRQSYTDDDGELDEVNFSLAVEKICNSREKGNDIKEKSFEKLTLWEYIQLLFFNHTWNVLNPIFDISKESLRNLLENIRKTRNDLAHFRNEISPEQQEQLKFCVDWFSQRQEEWDKLRQDSLYQKVFKELIAAKDVQQKENINNEGISPPDLPPLMILEQDGPHDSRYSPIADFLLSQPGNIPQIRQSYDELEVIIGGSLPDSARSHRSWWSNDTSGHTQAQSWLEAGWRTSYINMSDGLVTFVRIKEREKAYIGFFSLLLSELKKEKDFPIKTVSPDGASWIIVSSLPNPGQSFAQFSFSFTRDKRFRVELYLDTYNQITTKKVFDDLFINKQKYENELGIISWERIDQKRASRIAIYHPGQIMDSIDKLTKLRHWSVNKMVHFYKAISGDVQQSLSDILLFQ
jgi:hypothetical protein